MVKTRINHTNAAYEKANSELSEVERMILNDLIMQIWGKFAFIYPLRDNLSDDKIRPITGMSPPIPHS